MAKVLLTNKNSVWGVIVKPQSSNVYRHVLSFDTPALKDEFINNELMNGKDYKVEIQKMSPVSLIYNDAASATFQADPKNYPKETIYSLLNKDFAIVLINDYEKDPAKHKYLFYALNPKRNGATVTFAAELDIFFTYDVKDMFNDEETEITRAMFDRFDKEANGTVKFKDTYLDTPLVNKESFDGDFSNILFPTDVKANISPDINIEFIDKGSYLDHILVESDKVELTKYLSELKWKMVTIATKASEDIPAVKSPKKFSRVENTKVNITALGERVINSLGYSGRTNETNMPFINLISPMVGSESNANSVYLSSLDKYAKIRNIYTSWNPTAANPLARISFADFEKTFLENANVVKNSLQVLASSPLPILNNYKFIATWIGFSWEIEFVLISPNTATPITSNDPTYCNFEVFSMSSVAASAPEKACIGIKTIMLDKKDIDTGLKIHNDVPVVLDIANKRNIKLSPKINFAPYRQFQLGSSTKNKSFIIPQNFTKDEIKVRINASYLSTTWGYQIDIKNYGNINSSLEYIESNRNFIFEDFSNYAIPTDKSQWEEFITRNSASQNASFLNKGLGVGLGVLGAIAAPFTGGASLALAGAGLASVAAKSAGAINSQIAQRKDVKNSPNEIVNNGSTFSFDYITKKFTPYIQEYKLEPVLLNAIYDHIYKYGYNWNSELAKPAELIDMRYYFNYLEASDMFENIKLNLSAPIKQIINDTLETGITIWNYRDKDTFKGVKNYEYENAEMSILNVN